jgi:hypothetical protein
VRAGATTVGFSREIVKLIRHEKGYHFYDSIPVPLLDRAVKRWRLIFCLEKLRRLDINNSFIVFTDERTITQDLNLGESRGGIEKN